ncbi:hypothetical protein GAYE_SCF53G6110 [Galdieria yellowstonensis]|uniref:Uncharacterized protein n=1 Tax=Galdieria yellowstonensis TaxID=3028027 RepID=A0AAV9IL00_9RHOD|nr:hypothetical protein GAYE_SCF53G6110 [Galdieria yellowstonensis]
MNHPMSRVLLGLLSWTFQSSKIPSSLNVSSNLRNEKGRFEFHEPLSRHQSHCTVLKLLSAIVIANPQSGRSHNISVPERGGIRTHEFVLLKSLLLWSVSNNDGAFDRAPPEALFRKLESLGVEGGCLELYCGLYRRSWTELPLRIFEILAPESFLFVEEQDWMILHLVFCSIWSSIINGTSVENRLPGLMFAYDVVFLKYKLSRRLWQLQGKDMPVVEEYRHLRIDLNTSLTVEGFILQLQIQRYGQ